MPEDTTGSLSDSLTASETGQGGAIGKSEGLGDNITVVMLEEGLGAGDI